MGIKLLRNETMKVDSDGEGEWKYSCPGPGEECVEAGRLPKSL